MLKKSYCIKEGLVLQECSSAIYENSSVLCRLAGNQSISLPEASGDRFCTNLKIIVYLWEKGNKYIF
jgi:hypothetical protein